MLTLKKIEDVGAFEDLTPKDLAGRAFAVDGIDIDYPLTITFSGDVESSAFRREVLKIIIATELVSYRGADLYELVKEN